jgi:hypothetical protein
MAVDTFEDLQVWPQICKGGKVVLARIHRANFKGKANSSKCKVLIVLYQYHYTKHHNNGLTLGQLHLQSGVSTEYLKTHLHKWTKWKYLNRKPVVNEMTGHLCFSYEIAARGAHMLEDIAPREKLVEWEQQLLAWRYGLERNAGGTV